MTNPELEERARQYAELCQISLELQTPLGYGQDGSVWKSDQDTAVKAFARLDNYRKELACYQRLAESNVTSIQGFSVPRLVHHDASLMVVEIGIVKPPYLLDFGKAWLDQPPDFSPEVMQDHYAQMKERFEDRYPIVLKLLAALRGYGIHYLDAKPGNIAFEEPPN